MREASHLEAGTQLDSGTALLILPGTVTGEITGTIVPVGAASELLPAGPAGIRSVCTTRASVDTNRP